MSIDLHTHSTCSDGVLTPADLVRRAADRGVDMLALTDHDDTAGLAEAQQAAVACGIEFIAGVEVSTTWQSQTIHILGLGIDADEPGLMAELDLLRSARDERAARIAALLEGEGIADSLAGAKRHAGAATIGRSHFARHLVAQRVVRNANDAFRLYLGAGKVAYVAPAWPAIPAVVSCIHGAGGLAVLAHPDRYRLTPLMMRSLYADFAQAGGDAVEINEEGRFASSTQVRLALEFGFALSAGSDFHAPGKGVPDLGDAPVVPAGVPAVWQRLRVAA